MSRTAVIPAVLRGRPVRADRAVAAGLLTRRQLQGSDWVAVHPGVYAHRELTLDLAYRQQKVGIEYEGAGHRTAAVFQRDLRRLNGLHMAGWTILRYGPADVFHHRQHMIDEVRRALGRPPQS